MSARDVARADVYVDALALLQRLGPELRDVRRRYGYTQRDVAYATGIAQSTISCVENGHRAPSIEVTVLLLEWCLDVVTRSNRSRRTDR